MALCGNLSLPPPGLEEPTDTPPARCMPTNELNNCSESATQPTNAHLDLLSLSTVPEECAEASRKPSNRKVDYLFSEKYQGSFIHALRIVAAASLNALLYA